MALPQPKGKQLEVLDLKPEGHNVVLGTAGSGKTTLATVIWDAIEVGLSGLPLRNVLWNCAAVPEGFAVWLCCGM